ncbi:hypothetical protein [Plantactinospora sp. WMMB782]|uniref:hypothetical protein n=1 Tax=Plantactinospora sp. WMMB782 TaxID=3404121 RepID=UPI003B94EAFE
MSVFSIEVGHGAETVAVWGEQNGYRFAVALTPDEADDLAARLTQQARYAREVTVDDDAD